MPAPRTPPPPPPPYKLTDSPLSHPRRFELPDNDEADLDSLKSLGLKLSRPASAHGSDSKQSPDSPTLGHSSPVIPAMSQAMIDELEGAEERERENRYMDAIAPLPDLALEPKTRRTEGEQPAVSGAGSNGDAASPEERPNKRDSYVVDPATIPIRTSSSNAVANGDRFSTTTSPLRSPKKHRSLGSVPERPERTHSKRVSSMTPALDEHDWLSSQNPRPKVNGDGLGRNLSVRSQEPERYASSSLSQQPTLYHPPSQQPPPHTLQQGIGADLIAQDRSVSWSPEKENILKGPFNYLEAHPGKDIRTQLISAFNAWLRVPEPSLAIIQRVVAMLHTASLLIDDVEDSSLLRRGVPAAHHIFGAPQTINTANYVYFCALQELLTLNNPECIRIYTDELLNLHRGQGMDLFWRDTLTCPSEDDYLEMVGNKTGGLFRLAIKLMCAESPSHTFQPSSRYSTSMSAEQQAPIDYVPLVNTIGLLFQIRDDYYNLSSSTYTANKGLCEDLTEGKFSFPIIHAIRSDPQNLVLINILKQKTKEDEVKRFAVSYMEQTGSFAYTRRVLRGLTRKALGLVEEVDHAFQSRSGALDSGGAGNGGLHGGDMVRAILEKMKVDRGESIMGTGGPSV